MSLNMLPEVDFCGLSVTRLVIGGNPFGGFSHQSKSRDDEMLNYHTVERIKETWRRAEAAGINTMVTNNEAPNVLKALKEYFAEDGKLKWIAQVNNRVNNDMIQNIDEAVKLGCKALYFHGGVLDGMFIEKEEGKIREWCDYARSLGVPAGGAAHDPRVHMWLDELKLLDFHAVCFFNCGSLRFGAGYKFRLKDVLPAVECVRAIRKPVIAYKIMGAGRIDAHMAFEYAFEHIKSCDVVNVGMHRGDRDDMVELNADIARDILGCGRNSGKNG